MRHRLFLLAGLLLLLMLPVQAQDDSTPADDWWRDTTWYEIFVRSFYDSDGDGIGDLQGVIEKLDYLNDGDPTTTDDLGITGIWLMPVNEAASYHGYDAIDYEQIEADFGTNEDFRELIDAAHERGIRVIVDLVLNHTSTEHPWFIEAADRNPVYIDWYKWESEHPGYLSPLNVPGWHELEDRFYYGAFWSGMPDLNYDNPEVHEEMLAIARYWLEDMGVDGFRLDAIRYLIEEEINERMVLADTPANRAWLAEFNAYLNDVNPATLTVGEIWAGAVVVQRYMDDNAVDVAFEFELAETIVSAAQQGFNRNLYRKLEQLLRDFPDARYATFLTNHDQTRTMNILNDVGANKAAASVLLLGPGTPFIYYGEEIGMRGDKPDEFIRTPMQWDDTPVTGGFTSASAPWQPLTPGFADTTVANQIDNPASLLSHYRDMVHLRNEHSALRQGETILVDTDTPRVVSFIRHTPDQTLLILINLDDRAAEDYSLSLRESPLSRIESAEFIRGSGDVTAPALDDSGGFTDYRPLSDDLPPYTTIIIELAD